MRGTVDTPGQIEAIFQTRVLQGLIDEILEVQPILVTVDVAEQAVRLAAKPIPELTPLRMLPQHPWKMLLDLVDHAVHPDVVRLRGQVVAEVRAENSHAPILGARRLQRCAHYAALTARHANEFFTQPSGD